MTITDVVLHEFIDELALKDQLACRFQGGWAFKVDNGAEHTR